MSLCLCSGIITCFYIAYSFAYMCAYALVKTIFKGIQLMNRGNISVLLQLSITVIFVIANFATFNSLQTQIFTPISKSSKDPRDAPRKFARNQSNTKNIGGEYAIPRIKRNIFKTTPFRPDIESNHCKVFEDFTCRAF